MIQIKNRFTHEIIHQDDFETIKECVEDAVQKGIGLSRANLWRANLNNANLIGANLWRANLISADLSCANLTNADLTNANLTNADLTNADLTNADLAGADLTGAYLVDAILTDADLAGADLTNADLTNADLAGANLTGAYLVDAILTDAKMPDKPVILPPIGEAIVGFKKLRDNIVIKIEVPADAQRVSTWGSRKCRASALKVLEVVDFGHGRCEQTGLPHNPRNVPTDHMPGKHDPNFVYQLGETHHPYRFDLDERDDCRPGLHFFMTLKEAEDW